MKYYFMKYYFMLVKWKGINHVNKLDKQVNKDSFSITV